MKEKQQQNACCVGSLPTTICGFWVRNVFLMGLVRLVTVYVLLQIAGELGRFPPYFGEKAWLCMNSECHLCSFLPSVFTGP